MYSEVNRLVTKNRLECEECVCQSVDVCGSVFSPQCKLVWMFSRSI